MCLDGRRSAAVVQLCCLSYRCNLDMGMLLHSRNYPCEQHPTKEASPAEGYSVDGEQASMTT